MSDPEILSSVETVPTEINSAQLRALGYVSSVVETLDQTLASLKDICVLGGQACRLTVDFKTVGDHAELGMFCSACPNPDVPARCVASLMGFANDRITAVQNVTLNALAGDFYEKTNLKISFLHEVEDPEDSEKRIHIISVESLASLLPAKLSGQATRLFNLLVENNADGRFSPSLIQSESIQVAVDSKRPDFIVAEFIDFLLSSPKKLFDITNLSTAALALLKQAQARVKLDLG